MIKKIINFREEIKMLILIYRDLAHPTGKWKFLWSCVFTGHTDTHLSEGTSSHVQQETPTRKKEKSKYMAYIYIYISNRSWFCKPVSQSWIKPLVYWGFMNTLQDRESIITRLSYCRIKTALFYSHTAFQYFNFVFRLELETYSIYSVLYPKSNHISKPCTHAVHILYNMHV